MSDFSAREFQRYSRHIQLPAMGVEGQLRLKSAAVSVVGCGGLAAPLALYLAGAGVGKITLIDGDSVDLSNLQRQIGFSENDIGSNKAAALAAKLRALNSDVQVESIEQMLSSKNAATFLAGSDLVIDCSDQFFVRSQINSYCIQQQLAWLFASVTQMSGQMALFLPQGPCFHCLFPTPPTTATDCNSAGVLASLPGVLGSLQASTALQYLAGIPCTANQLTLIEAVPLQIQNIAITKRSGCSACATAQESTPQAAQQASQPTTRPTTQPVINGPENVVIDAAAQVIDVRDPSEHQAFNIGGINYPLSELLDNIEALHEQIAKRFAQHAKLNFDKQKPIIVYCHSGQRSAQACELLKRYGFDAHNLQGGIQAWLTEHA